MKSMRFATLFVAMTTLMLGLMVPSIASAVPCDRQGYDNVQSGFSDSGTDSWNVTTEIDGDEVTIGEIGYDNDDEDPYVWWEIDEEFADAGYHVDVCAFGGGDSSNVTGSTSGTLLPPLNKGGNNPDISNLAWSVGFVPPPVTVTLVKQWDVIDDGDEVFDEDAVTVTFDADGETVADGGTFDADPGTEVTITETVDGFPDECTFDAIGFEDDELAHTVDDTDETVTVINEVTCDEVDDLLIEAPDTPETGETLTPPSDDVEVLGETLTRPAGDVEVLGEHLERPTRVDAGSGGLATTGVPAFLLALMALGAMLAGAGALTAVGRRR